MTSYIDDGETLHGSGCLLCGDPAATKKTRHGGEITIGLICWRCWNHYDLPSSEYARRVSNALAAPVKGERFLRRLVVAAGEPEATVLAAPVRENAGETSERRFDVGPGFVRARECPDCFHTRCGEDCVCNCDAAHAEYEAAYLRGQLEKAKAQLAERTAEVERLKASKLCLSCLVEYEPPGNAGWRR